MVGRNANDERKPRWRHSLQGGNLEVNDSQCIFFQTDARTLRGASTNSTHGRVHTDDMHTSRVGMRSKRAFGADCATDSRGNLKVETPASAQLFVFEVHRPCPPVENGGPGRSSRQCIQSSTRHTAMHPSSMHDTGNASINFEKHFCGGWGGTQSLRFMPHLSKTRIGESQNPL